MVERDAEKQLAIIAIVANRMEALFEWELLSAQPR